MTAGVDLSPIMILLEINCIADSKIRRQVARAGPMQQVNEGRTVGFESAVTSIDDEWLE